MSYPGTRHFGDQGEINASFRAATAAPDFVSTPVSMPVATDGPPRTEYSEGVTQLHGLSEEERADFFRRHDSFFV